MAGAFDVIKGMNSAVANNRDANRLFKAVTHNFGAVSETWAEGRSLFYPIDIESAPDRPLIQFTCMVPQQGYVNIYFPMPSGVQMADAMGYNDQDLGFSGYVAQQATKSGMGIDSIQSGMAAAGDFANLAKNLIPNDRASAIQLGAAAMGVDPAISAGIASVTQTAFNKNTITDFTGVNIRNHTFTFKMIARSPEEAQVVKKIQFAFRSGMYPTGKLGNDRLFFHFPPKWRIRFVSLPYMNDLEHLPQPYDCFLQNLSTNFNSSTQMWRNDKAPLEVDITVSFVETKALVANDIKATQYGFGTDGSNRGETLGDAIFGQAAEVFNPLKEKIPRVLKDFIGGAVSPGSVSDGSVGSSTSSSAGSNLLQRLTNPQGFNSGPRT